MKRTWTIIGVRDVPASFKWYQSLFGQPATPPAHDHFGQILDTDGTVLLCLHQWGAHEHPSLMSPDKAPPGNGLLLFFRVDDFDRTLKSARSLVMRLEEEPHVNPNTQTAEFSLRDPDGYYVTISALSAPRFAGRRPTERLPEHVGRKTKECVSEGDAVSGVIADTEALTLGGGQRARRRQSSLPSSELILTTHGVIDPRVSANVLGVRQCASMPRPL